MENIAKRREDMEKGLAHLQYICWGGSKLGGHNKMKDVGAAAHPATSTRKLVHLSERYYCKIWRLDMILCIANGKFIYVSHIVKERKHKKINHLAW